MRELSPRARSLIHRMQRADGPTTTDRERMRVRLAPLLATGSVVAATTAPAAGAAAALPTATAATGLSGTLAGVAPVVAAKVSVAQLVLWGALGVGAGLTTTAATLVLTSPSPPDAPAASATAVSGPLHPPAAAPVAGRGSARAPEPSAPPGDAPVRLPSISESVREATAEGRPEAPRATASTGSAEWATHALGGPSSTLAEETSLLRAAQTARREGKESLALGLLEEHAKRFPRGVLRTERSVARALALCAQGQAEASNRLREKVLHEAPNVPAVSRIRKPCAAGQSR